MPAAPGSAGRHFYKWKAKFGRLDVSEARKLKSLEDENRRLKKLLAEQMLDNAALKDLVGKTVNRLGRVMQQFTPLLTSWTVATARHEAARGRPIGSALPQEAQGRHGGS